MDPWIRTYMYEHICLLYTSCAGLHSASQLGYLSVMSHQNWPGQSRANLRNSRAIQESDVPTLEDSEDHGIGGGLPWGRQERKSAM